MKIKSQPKGFTLVELLIVIAIIAILAAVVVLIINPLELTRQGRDAARLSDMANLQQAITVAVQEATVSATDALCVGNGGGDYDCVGKSTDANARVSNGTGWVKVDLSNQKAVSIPTLPQDPSNGTTYHYVYCADTVDGNQSNWVVVSPLESNKYKDKATTDGGPDNTKYETGSKLSLFTAGSCTY